MSKMLHEAEPWPEERIRDTFCSPTPGPATRATTSADPASAWTADPAGHSANVSSSTQTTKQLSRKHG